MAALLNELPSFTKLDHILLVSGFPLFAMVIDEISCFLAVGRQRGLHPGWLAEGFMHEFRSEILGHVSDHFSRSLSIHQMKEIVLAPFVAGSQAICQRVHMDSE